MTKRSLLRATGAERGQTLLEFALVAPLILVFLLAIVDFGIAIDRRLVLDHAVREGARYASVGGDVLATGTPASAADVSAYTVAQAQGVISSADVCYDGAGGVRVSIAYSHDFVTGFTSFFNTSVGSIQMDPKASARVEQELAGTVPPC